MPDLATALAVFGGAALLGLAWWRMHRQQGRIDRLHSELSALAAALDQERAEMRTTKIAYFGALNTAPDGLVGFQPDGRFAVANELMRSVLMEAGFALTDATTREDLLAFLLDRTTEAERPPVLKEAGSWEFEIALRPGRWMRVSEKRSASLWSIVRIADITDYKEAVIALEGAVARERETTAIYRNFVAMVSHQFRTPLAIIDSSAQRLVRRAGPASVEEVAQRAGKIRKAAERLTQLVNNTLNAARLDAGQIDFDPRLCDLAVLVAEACARHRELAPHRRIVLEAASEPILCRCDPVLFDQVIANLLSNASKYSASDAPIEVRCWNENGFAHCAVRDEGIGIPQDELPRLFERFFRARTAAGVTGTGLGLTFARHLVDLHEGRIEVASQEGRGSTFTVSLPLAQAQSALDAA